MSNFFGRTPHSTIKARVAFGWGFLRQTALLSFCLLATTAFGQKTIKLEKADKLLNRTDNGLRSDWVIGNVVFTQNQTTIYCDSAKRDKKENSLEAFGRIKITDGDSVTVTALSLFYDGNTRVAKLRKNVVFNKLQTAILYTDFLDFDRQRNKARYFNGGKLVDSTNTLTSTKGYYDLHTNLAAFKHEVKGVNKDFTLTSDTLQYHTKTKVIYFKDHTTVVDAEGKTATYKTGYYDTQNKLSQLQLATIETPTYRMTGNNYFLDDQRLFYQANGNVVMTSKDENLTVYGDHGDYYKAQGFSKVYGHSYVAKVDEAGDTLFLAADTLVSIDSKEANKKKLIAYHNVKIYKSNMQGVADSVVYVSKDSLLIFFRDPVLWNEGSQMTADTIKIRMKQKNIDKIYLVNNSFVASQDSLKNFNQIKGRLMTAHFSDKKIKHVDVSGNGQSIYFATEEKEVKDSVHILKVTFLTGINKIECSNMKINFADGKVNNITFMKKPDASFIPTHLINEADTKLEGFVWRGADRPQKKDVVKGKGRMQTAEKLPVDTLKKN